MTMRSIVSGVSSSLTVMFETRVVVSNEEFVSIHARLQRGRMTVSYCGIAFEPVERQRK